ncbi:SDR family oxidoreductase [Sphingobacterium daejeonense]|uniref:SDR family oxidoreductase n=1 Tax=Sphingobacterium daejeonense TaxID=371142 RepID=A0ABW3RKJ8_9SPHI
MQENWKWFAIENKGCIVLFSSMYGLESPFEEVYIPNLINNPIEYGVGKAGIIQMTKYFGAHWGKFGVRFNCVSSGPFPNNKVQKEQSDFIEKLNKKCPMGRIGHAIEIAGAELFLLSEASSYVNGHNLIVDCGWTIW